MKTRTGTIAEMIELCTAVESRRRAEAGDPTLFLERLEAGRATPHEIADQALIARLIRGGKKKRGPKFDPSLEAKQRQAAFFFHVLTEVIKLEEKVARGRVADFFGIADRTIEDWIGDQKKRVGGEAWPALVAANVEAFVGLRAGLMGVPRIAELLRVPE
jgi:hypothetical protein